jgi:lipid-binding SYLF domain-containing protein
MRMAGLGAGLGAGLKDFRAVFIFHSDEALDRFVDQGWEFGAEAEAAAAAGQIGGAVGSQAAAGTSGAASGMAAKGGRHATTATMYRDLEIYQFTEAGLALQATLAGTKYWPDRALNP